MNDRRPFGPNRPSGDGLRKVGLYTAIPTIMVVGPVLGYLGGSWLEGKWGGAPWPSTGGAILGMIASFRQIYLVLKRGEPPKPRD
jgi:hypothetical protein